MVFPPAGENNALPPLRGGARQQYDIS